MHNRTMLTLFRIYTCGSLVLHNWRQTLLWTGLRSSGGKMLQLPETDFREGMLSYKTLGHLWSLGGTEKFVNFFRKHVYA